MGVSKGAANLKGHTTCKQCKKQTKKGEKKKCKCGKDTDDEDEEKAEEEGEGEGGEEGEGEEEMEVEADPEGEGADVTCFVCVISQVYPMICIYLCGAACAAEVEDEGQSIPIFVIYVRQQVRICLATVCSRCGHTSPRVCLILLLKVWPIGGTC